VSPANEVLASRWDERIQRLGLGIEPQDAVRRSRIGFPVQLKRDGVPVPLPRRRRPRDAAPWEPHDVLKGFRRRRSCRFAVIAGDDAPDPLPLRLLDASQRFVPRRLEVALAPGRVCRPALFPGAAYDVPAGAIGIRGRVLRGGEPVRWARVEATRTGDAVVVGRAHGDEHGEFVLLLGPGAARGAELTLPLEVRVTPYAPDAAPVPPDDDEAADPLWDLPLEAVPLDEDDGEAVLSGEVLPDGYVARLGSSSVLEFRLDGLQSVEFDFS
jgi:hypothetical protein